MIPDAGGTYFLPRLLGMARATGLAMLGDKLPAQQAADWGLIWKCVDDAELAATVDAMLQYFATAPTRGLAATKRALYDGTSNTLEAQLDVERDLQRELGRSDDYREGVGAFMAKRPPRFTGKYRVSDRPAPATPREAQQLAERVASAMFARDRASQAMGIRVASVGAGHAELTMMVRPDMVNGHATCHGGFIFTLADSAFAFACNSYNLVTVASGCSIEFVSPAREGDTLTAVARERSASGRTGVYDIEVNNQDGALIALFRGKSYRIKGNVIDDPG